MQGFTALRRSFFAAYFPEPKLPLSRWADEHFYLSAESSASGGKWRTLSYQREIMDAITDPEVEEVWVQKSARVGFTKILNIATAYFIARERAAVMMVQPTIEDAPEPGLGEATEAGPAGGPRRSGPAGGTRLAGKAAPPVTTPEDITALTTPPVTVEK